MENSCHKTEIEKLWNDIHDNLQKLYSPKKVNFKEIATLPKAIELFCIYANGIKDKEQSNKKVEYRGFYILYMKISEFMKNFNMSLLNQCENLKIYELLAYYHEVWNTYRKSTKILGSFCVALNKYWVQCKRTKFSTKFFTINEEFGRIWCQYLLKPLCHQINQEVLLLVSKRHKGENITSEMIRNIMKFYLLVNEKDPCFEFFFQTYKEEFEPIYLKAVEDFYRKASLEYLRNHTIKEYIAYVDNLMSYENSLVMEYFHPSTTISLRERLQQFLIHTKILLICITLFTENNDEYWKRFIRITEGIRIENYKVFEEHMRKEETKDKFKESFDRVIGTIINKNHITEYERPDKSAELLAFHCDNFLKCSKNKKELNIEEEFENVVIIVGYLKNKYNFAMTYKNLLSKRLLLEQSVSREVETFMVLKLKDTIGFANNWNLEKVLSDIDTSKELGKMFENYLLGMQETLSLNFEVKVVSLGLVRKVLPYITRESKLKWVPNRSSGEITTNCFSNQYILKASTYQIAVLLQFNNTDTLSVQQLQENTQINLDTLLKVLEIFTKVNMLISEEKVLTPCSKLTLNLKYKSKTNRINLNVPIEKLQKKKDITLSEHEVAIERKSLLEAAVVRIVKNSKGIQCQDLIMEVQKAVKSRFYAQESLIYATIKNLIERYFIERSKIDSDFIVYTL
ncbi:CUL1 [Cordylochernes scorpioides]|uniref:CUL1 n=1 Tax=Cordylochernes scorpioides TaxID=51811 RepID=A0ABY6LAS6_9ARAC|nr:CUL1 [Cordylochernes scorpioides]